MFILIFVFYERRVPIFHTIAYRQKKAYQKSVQVVEGYTNYSELNIN